MPSAYSGRRCDDAMHKHVDSRSSSEAYLHELDNGENCTKTHVMSYSNPEMNQQLERVWEVELEYTETLSTPTILRG
jgi:hypothetical protein